MKQFYPSQNPLIIPDAMNMQETKHPRANIIFILCCLTIVIMGASVDMFVPSLPFIKADFNVPAYTVRFIVTSYLLSYGIFQLLAGALSDSFGRRNIIIIALLGYTLSTALIPLSPNIDILLSLRFFQGLFAAGIGVISRALVNDCFQGKTFAKKVSKLNIAWAVGPILSPYLGGYLQHLFNWQATFYFLASYAAIITLLTLILLPETIMHRHPFRLPDITNNYRVILSSRVFRYTAILCGLAYGFITLYNVIGPFLVEATLHYSPIVYGRIALALGSAWIAGNFILQRIIVAPHIKKIIYAVLSANLVIAVLLTIFALIGSFNLWTITVPPLLLFFGGGIIFSYGFASTMRLFPTMAGSASAMLGSIFSILAGIISGATSFLKTEELLPFAICYLVLTLLMAGLQLAIKKK